ncbi:MAG: hypothetical protein QMD92_04755 [bacterium]|nr:hypothetical protein [bacterium]
MSIDKYLKDVVKIDKIAVVKDNKRVYKDRKTYYWHQNIGAGVGEAKDISETPWIIESI